MRTTKKPLRSKNQSEKSWLARQFGSIVFSTLVFSSVVYAISWPTVPGETGYPVEGSFWNYFQTILVDTGASTDGTVKKSESLGKYRGRTAIIADANGNIGVGTGTEAGYTMSVSGQALFSNTVTGTPPTSSGHLATKGYVDGIVSAGGGGYGQCYRKKTTTAAYPACAAGYTRSYAAYGELTDNANPISDTYSIYFENSVGGAWFQNFGHIYLYYTQGGTYNNNFNIYDDQDYPLVGINGWQNDMVIGNYGQVFGARASTYMSYTTVSPATFINTQLAGTPSFGYAVCCK